MNDRIQVQLSGRRDRFDFDIDLDLESTGITAIFGRSGSGKTTLLRSIAGLDKMTGRVTVNGTVWQDSASKYYRSPESRRTGYVFQGPALFPHRTVRGNLEYALHRVPAGQLQRVTLAQVVDWLELHQLLDRPASALSGGEAQRVAVARALLVSPSLLLMDEPVASLDVEAKIAVLGHLDQLRRTLLIPVLYVTHAIEEVARLADRVVWLESGRVRATGSPAEVLSRVDVGQFLGDEAGGVIHAVIAQHEIEHQLTVLDSAWGQLYVQHIDAAIGHDVHVRIRASDVSLSLEREHRSSILNVLPAEIRDLTPATAGQMWARATPRGRDGEFLLARITTKSAEQLGLRPGLGVFLRVKSVSVR